MFLARVSKKIAIFWNTFKENAFRFKRPMVDAKYHANASPKPLSNGKIEKLKNWKFDNLKIWKGALIFLAKFANLAFRAAPACACVQLYSNATAHQDLEVQVPELEKQTAPFASIGPAVSGPACRSACQNLRCHPQTNLSQNAKVMHIRVFARRRRSVRSANGRYAHACGMELALVAIYTYMGVALVATRIHSAWN